jgi:hypothetical protein
MTQALKLIKFLVKATQAAQVKAHSVTVTVQAVAVVLVQQVRQEHHRLVEQAAQA